MKLYQLAVNCSQLNTTSSQRQHGVYMMSQTTHRRLINAGMAPCFPPLKNVTFFKRTLFQSFSQILISEQ